MKKILIIGGSCLGLALAACDASEQPYQEESVNYSPRHPDDHSDALMAGVAGAAVGYMAGNSNRGATRTRVVEKHIYYKPKKYYSPYKKKSYRSSSYRRRK